MPNETIRENNLFLTLSLPDLDWLEEYARRLCDAYRTYAASRSGENALCRLNIRGEMQDCIVSLVLDAEEARGEALAVYRRLAMNWLLPRPILLSDRQLLRLMHCLPCPHADGYFFRDGEIYAFRNHFRPGMEEGLRRSARRHFIEEIPLTKKELPR